MKKTIDWSLAKIRDDGCRILEPGCHFLNPFCGQAVSGTISLRIQQLDVRCETKTKVGL